MIMDQMILESIALILGGALFGAFLGLLSYFTIKILVTRKSTHDE
jgi:ABC-type antimicrobial peptide transport system permease subunit